MKKTNETFNWDIEQIEAYAAAFREGDAVNAGNEWHKVNKDNILGVWWTSGYTVGHNVSIVSGNGFYLNYSFHEEEDCYEGIVKGFLKSRTELPYKIIMPKDYEVKDGDKLVWLGKSNDFLTFGKVYEASGAVSMLGTHYTADDGSCRFIAPLAVKYWGVIPKWENIKEENL